MARVRDDDRRGLAKGGDSRPYHTFRVDLKAPEHPILKGLPPSFLPHDELNQGLTMQPGITMLATAYDDPENRAKGEGKTGVGQGRADHVGVALPQGAGLHHGARARPASVRTPGFMATFQRGVEWAATGEVTIPPPPGLRDGK